MRHWVIYRGPLERSRLSFLLEGFKKKYGELHFIWIFPGSLTQQRKEGFDNYITTQNLSSVHVVNDPLKKFFKTRSRLKKIIGNEFDSLICIGYSALWFAGGLKFRNLIWCVNGIPEEKEMTNGVPRIVTELNWKLCRFFAKPSAIIVVSDRMQALVSRQMPGVPIFSAPTCVDIRTFRRSNASKKKYFTYLGTGAPWQALDILSNVWQQIHNQDKSILFRVISRDPRSRILETNIDPANIDFVSSDNFDEVASWLNEAEVGFLIRRDNIVNRVSFPTKLAEYLAAGAWVISSDFDWEVKDYIQKYNCGLLLKPDESNVANAVLTYRNNHEKESLKMSIQACADALDRRLWIDKMLSNLSAVV